MSNRVRMRPGRWGTPTTVVALRESATAVLDEAVSEEPDSLKPAADVSESTRPQRVPLTEAGGMLKPTGGRKYRARLIESDRWGSSGFYARKVVERDGPLAWPIGTLMYLDHPTPMEEAERPERSVKDLAARITSTPVHESDGLYADIEVFPHAATLVEAMAETLGLSVRGEGTGTVGTVAGRSGYIIESINRGYSVDFVTKAGAGGKLVALLESARAAKIRESRNIGAWLESRLHLALTSAADDMYGDGYLTRDERITLSSAIGDGLAAWTKRVESDAPQLFQRDLWSDPTDGSDAAVTEADRRRLREAPTEDIRQALQAALGDAYGGDGADGTGTSRWLWVRDYDATKGLVWFDADDGDDTDTWQQSYTVTDAEPPVVALTGERTEVVARTVYEPAPSGADDTADAEPVPGSMGESARIREADPTEAPPPVAADPPDGAPPAVPNPSEGEEPTVGTQTTGPAPGTAGTADDSVALAEAQAARTKAETDLREAREAGENAVREAETARTELARLRAVEAARPVASRLLAESSLPAAAQNRVLAQVTGDVPLTEANVLDEATFKTRVEAAVTAEAAYVASLREASGEGRVTGLGTATASTVDATEAAKNQTALAEAFKAIGLDDKAALVAAGGRR